MDYNNFLNRLLTDLKVELTDEFDRNFQRKAFFDRSWPAEGHHNSKGSQLIRSGKLRRSINPSTHGHEIHWESTEPYADIQNSGGEITVTTKMKKYFWAKYYELTKGITTKKDGSTRSTAQNRALSADAQFYKNLALMKVGSKIKIPARQFIGDHPKVTQIVQAAVDEQVNIIEKEIYNALKQK